jgi:hypothetical protein
MWTKNLTGVCKVYIQICSIVYRLARKVIYLLNGVLCGGYFLLWMCRQSKLGTVLMIDHTACNSILSPERKQTARGHARLTLINPDPLDWLWLIKWSGTLFIFVYRYFKFKCLYLNLFIVISNLNFYISILIQLYCESVTSYSIALDM